MAASTKDLVHEISARTGHTPKQVKEMLGYVTDGINAVMTRHGAVKLTDFGTFERITRKARGGRNPSTGESIEIPARPDVRFKAATKLKESI